ncbi:MAG: hypothetical protein Q9163_002614 [Psora crenata]
MPPSQPSAQVSYHGKGYDIVREGLAEILVPAAPASTKGKAKAQAVFYNPIQQYSRDLSVLAVRAFADDYIFLKGKKQRKRQETQREARETKSKREPSAGNDEEGREVRETKRKREPNASNDEEGTEARETKRKREPSAGNDEEGGEARRTKRKREPSASNDEKEDIAPVDKKPKREFALQSGSADELEPVISITEGGGDVKADYGGGPKPPEKTKSRDGHRPKPETDATSLFRILDALSATGLRALRYGKEVPIATHITANDLSGSATASIKLNVEHNGLAEKIQPSTSDAINHLHRSIGAPKPGAGQYHVIDLDPYGTAAPFLDSAVRALVDGGLLCVTCTDAGVFASLGYLEKTCSQYGGLPLKGPHAHEGGIRLILHAIATAAARYGIAIEPLLSLSIDFYARLFVRVHRSPAEVKFLASKTMMVYNCDGGCGAWSVQHLAHARAKENRNGETIYKFTAALGPTAAPGCEHCGFKTHLAGPMWSGPLHNPHFIERILDMLPSLDKDVYQTIPRIEGMLTTALNENLDDVAAAPKEHAKRVGNTRAKSGGDPTPDHSDLPLKGTKASPASKDEDSSSQPVRPVPPLDPSSRAHHPFFFVPSTLSGVLHCVSPSDSAMRGALKHLGYRTTRSHTKAGSIVTDAPWSVIWEIMREWVQQKSPVKEDAIRAGTAGYGIMSKDRSKAALRDAKETLAEAHKCVNWEDMEQKLQALLYRMGKKPADGGKSGQSVVNPTEDEPAGVKDPGLGKQKGSMARLQDLKIIFDEGLGKESRGRRMVRYQQNPPDWGPMTKAK